MPHPDQKYIDALISNDELLIDELYRKFSGKIKCMVLKNSGTETDAADIFQEALMSLFYKAKSAGFVLTCPLDAFLYMVCKNRWLSELSKRKTHRVTFTDTDRYNDLGEDGFKLEENYKLMEAREILLMNKLVLLGDICRQLLQLSWSGKSMEEVARVMNISYGYARKRKSECMAKLISMIKRSPEFAMLKW
jgi:RNA polymerase sigma factor (sigma-70 family)